MRSLRRYLYGLLLLWPFLVRANDPHGIELRLRSGSYFPGDVLQIEAEMQRPDYASFELQIPSHPQLYFVAHTREPVRYEQGAYRQRALLLLQPMAAGAFELNAITARLSLGAQHIKVALPSLQFVVDSYAATDDSQALQPLPAQVFSPASRSPQLEWVVLLVVLLGLLRWLRQRRQRSTVDAVLSATEGLRELAAALERGDASVDLMERLLNRADVQLSDPLRAVLQAAVYGKRLDAAQLQRMIGTEVAR